MPEQEKQSHSKLGGIWKGTDITEEDIRQNRKEMFTVLEKKYRRKRLSKGLRKYNRRVKAEARKKQEKAQVKSFAKRG